MGLKVFANIAQWAGSLLSPASSDAADATAVAPTIRIIPRKATYTFLVGTLPISGKFTSQWIDTNQSGGSSLTVIISETLNSWNSITNALTVQGTNDPGLANALISSLYLSGSDSLQNGYVAPLFVPTRYWRIVLTNDASTAKTGLTVTANEASIPYIITPQQARAGLNGVAAYSGSLGLGGFGDGSNVTGLANGTVAAGYGGGVVPVTLGAAVTSGVAVAVNVAAVALRTPNVFRGGQLLTTAGGIAIWTPALTKKARLMKYKIEVGEDALGGGSNPVPFALGFAWATIAGAGSQPYNQVPGYLHRFVTPATVALATGGNLWDSGWIDLGNGIISNAAGCALCAGLQIPQSTGAITPTWTIASNQWEAITIGIKTLGAKGNFALVTQDFGGAASTSFALGAKVLAAGETVVIAVRTTNSVTGIPVLSATDTAGNTYVASAVTTNATDGANGSSLGFLTCVNAIGNSANVVTVSATNSPTQIEGIYLQYGGNGMGSGGVDAAVVGATGNSTSPSSGAYTPATAGDLLITAMASSTQLGTVPTVNNNFFVRGALLNANQKTIAVADNFGNGALNAGAVNIIMCGTEE